MTTLPLRHQESDKSELRRRQVLDAATECFRREGFHGSSIARISKVAGMSPGHIYHYFANKEAIVEAIAERERDEMAELLLKMEQDRAGGDLVARLTRHTAEVVERNSDPATVGLMLELGAEAARNPAIARILYRTDQAIARQFSALVDRIGAPAWLDAQELQLRTGMLAPLFRGLAMRALLEPDRDQAATVRLVNEIVQLLLGER